MNGANLDPSLDEIDVSHKTSHACNFENQLKMKIDNIRESKRHYDETLVLVIDYCWRSAVAHGSLGRDPSLAYFQTLRKALVEMKYNYLHLFF